MTANGKGRAKRSMRSTPTGWATSTASWSSSSSAICSRRGRMSRTFCRKNASSTRPAQAAVLGLVLADHALSERQHRARHEPLPTTEEVAASVGRFLYERRVVAEQVADGVVRGGGPNGADQWQLEADDGTRRRRRASSGKGLSLKAVRGGRILGHSSGLNHCSDCPSQTRCAGSSYGQGSGTVLFQRFFQGVGEFGVEGVVADFERDFFGAQDDLVRFLLAIVDDEECGERGDVVNELWLGKRPDVRGG